MKNEKYQRISIKISYLLLWCVVAPASGLGCDRSQSPNDFKYEAKSTFGSDIVRTSAKAPRSISTASTGPLLTMSFTCGLDPDYTYFSNTHPLHPIVGVSYVPDVTKDEDFRLNPYGLWIQFGREMRTNDGWKSTYRLSSAKNQRWNDEQFNPTSLFVPPAMSELLTKHAALAEGTIKVIQGDYTWRFDSSGLRKQLLRLSCITDSEFLPRPVKASDCARQPACETKGHCTYRKGRCIAARDEDCQRANLLCKFRGQCTAQKGDCVAASDKACQESEFCKQVPSAKCVAKGGKCIRIVKDSESSEEVPEQSAPSKSVQRIAISKRVYFYDHPVPNARRKAYLIAGDVAQCTARSINGFYRCSFTNSKGTTTSGYMRGENLGVLTLKNPHSSGGSSRDSQPELKFPKWVLSWLRKPRKTTKLSTFTSPSPPVMRKYLEALCPGQVIAKKDSSSDGGSGKKLVCACCPAVFGQSPMEDKPWEGWTKAATGNFLSSKMAQAVLSTTSCDGHDWLVFLQHEGEDQWVVANAHPMFSEKSRVGGRCHVLTRRKAPSVLVCGFNFMNHGWSHHGLTAFLSSGKHQDLIDALDNADEYGCPMGQSEYNKEELYPIGQHDIDGDGQPDLVVGFRSLRADLPDGVACPSDANVDELDIVEKRRLVAFGFSKGEPEEIGTIETHIRSHAP